MFTTGQVLEKSVGIKQTLPAVKDRYYDAKRQGRAVGIACGIKNSGIGNGAEEWGKARLVVEPDGTVSLYNGYTEMGQGLLTVLIQFAVEVTGLPAACSARRSTPPSRSAAARPPARARRLFGGRAVVTRRRRSSAPISTRARTLRRLAGRVYAADVVIDDTTALGAPVAKSRRTRRSATRRRSCILDAQGRVERVIAAHDVGRAVNPALCEGQIEGSIHMGLGYALTEELPCVDGMPVTFKLRELGVLRARDMPEVEVILVEEPEPEGPFGAKGVGEIGLVPTAAAVAGALEAFDGVRRTTLPMKDSPAARAMSVGPHPVARSVDAALASSTPTRTSTAAWRRSACRRRRRAPANFLEILERVWWRLDRALDERVAARRGALLRRRGAAARHDRAHRPPRVADFIEGSLDVLADACEELGMRAVLCYGATERNGGREEARRGLAECRRFIRGEPTPAGARRGRPARVVHRVRRDDPRGGRAVPRAGHRAARARRRGRGRRRGREAARLRRPARAAARAGRAAARARSSRTACT